MKPKLISLIILFIAITTAHAQTTTPLDDYILGKMKDAKIPGFAFAIVKNGKIALAKGYGYANVDKDIPFTPNTIHHEVISESKVVTATALFKLFEQGLFQLDDPINNYLPFPVSNPFFPNVSITFRMLLCHKASLISNEEQIQYFYNAPGTAQELGAYLHDLLVPGGSLYNASTSYLNYAPGTRYTFSNVDYALLGYLVQRISGMPFYQYCDQNIFQPLCMNHTAWYHNQLDTNIISHPYYYSKGSSSINRPIDYGLYEGPAYPAVQLKTTVIDWSRFMLMHLNYGKLDGVKIIDSTTELLMRTSQEVVNTFATIEHDNDPVSFRRDECFGFYHVIEYTNNSKEYFGRNGNDIGTVVQSWFNVNDNTIITVYCNGGYLDDETIPTIFDVYEHLNLTVANTIFSATNPDLKCDYSFNPCQHNSDYWKNNFDRWALNSIPMKLGTKLYYSKNQILDLLNKPVNGDASIKLGKALIAAKFNIAQGSELSPIIQSINTAMTIIGDKRLPYDNPVSFSSATGIQMLALAATLDSYNSGNLNTIPCSGYSSSFTKSNPENEIDKASNVYSLSVFPNPSSGNTMISFSVAQSQKVLVKVFDLSGRIVKTLTDKVFEKGEHQINWNANNMNAGIYLVKMEAMTFSETKKLVVVK